MASIDAQQNRAGRTYRVLWRQDGRQRSLTFENLPAAERFKTLLDDHGPDEALRVIEADEIGRHVPSVGEWLHTHIENLTGVQPATLRAARRQAWRHYTAAERARHAAYERIAVAEHSRQRSRSRDHSYGLEL